MTRSFLLLHGMNCTGAVWSNFKTFYEARGVRVFTPTLRPELRVRTKPPRALRDLRFSDYVGDVEAELRRIQDQTGGAVSVIGHSMGGLLAQALAERNLPNAAVFISPTPPAGVRTPEMTRFWKTFRVVRALGLVPRALPPWRGVAESVAFNRVPKAERAAAAAHLVFESREAFADFDTYAIDETKIKIPVLTVSATRDLLVPADVTRLTAAKYASIGGAFKEYAEHAHWLYAEPGWEQPAQDILDWVQANT